VQKPNRFCQLIIFQKVKVTSSGCHSSRSFLKTDNVRHVNKTFEPESRGWRSVGRRPLLSSKTVPEKNVFCHRLTDSPTHRHTNKTIKPVPGQIVMMFLTRWPHPIEWILCCYFAGASRLEQHRMEPVSPGHRSTVLCRDSLSCCVQRAILTRRRVINSRAFFWQRCFLN
jgi:hypothetical protein